MDWCPTSIEFKKQCSYAHIHGKTAAITEEATKSFGDANQHNDILLSDEEIYLYLDQDIAITRDIERSRPFHIVIWFNYCNVRNVLEFKDKYPEQFDKVTNALSKLRGYLGLDELKIWVTERNTGKYHAHIQVANGDCDVNTPELLYRKTAIFFKKHY